MNITYETTKIEKRSCFKSYNRSRKNWQRLKKRRKKLKGESRRLNYKIRG